MLLKNVELHKWDSTTPFWPFYFGWRAEKLLPIGCWRKSKWFIISFQRVDWGGWRLSTCFCFPLFPVGIPKKWLAGGSEWQIMSSFGAISCEIDFNSLIIPNIWDSWHRISRWLKYRSNWLIMTPSVSPCSLGWIWWAGTPASPQLPSKGIRSLECMPKFSARRAEYLSSTKAKTVSILMTSKTEYKKGSRLR